MGTVRLLPLLAFAAICLVALKAAGLIFADGYMLTGSAPAAAQNEPAKPQATPQPAEQTPAAAPQPSPEGPAAQAPETPPAPDEAGAGPETEADPAGPAAAPSSAELAVLKSLSERRKQLDAHARELQLRENLLKAAEKRVAARIAELKAIEGRIEAELSKRDEARQAEYDKLVTLYAKMKPKKAAQIFNRLDIGVLTDLVRQMQPRTVSPIFASMDPAVVQRVTVQIVRERAREREGDPATAALPKITAQNP